MALAILFAGSIHSRPIGCRGRVAGIADRNHNGGLYITMSDRDIYFLATDWHKPKGDGTGTLSIGDTLYEIAVPFGSLVKVSVSGDAALYPLESENEVIAFDGTSARLSGEGSATFVLCKNGEKRPFTVDFTRCSVQAITL